MSDVRRYRALTREELEGLELEFARFLASQGMPATEWARVSSEEPGKVEALIWEFSTMFWETTTSRLTYLERNDGGDQWYFKFGEDTAQLLRIDPEGTQFRGANPTPKEPGAKEWSPTLNKGPPPFPDGKAPGLNSITGG